MTKTLPSLNHKPLMLFETLLFGSIYLWPLNFHQKKRGINQFYEDHMYRYRSHLSWFISTQTPYFHTQYRYMWPWLRRSSAENCIVQSEWPQLACLWVCWPLVTTAQGPKPQPSQTPWDLPNKDKGPSCPLPPLSTQLKNVYNSKMVSEKHLWDILSVSLVTAPSLLRQFTRI